MTTTADLLRRRADDDNAALFIGDGAWTYRELVEEGSRRAALFDELRDDDRPPHIGVLLDNVPDYLFWLTAAALSGGVIVGVNSTYRGDQLGLLIRHTDCQLLVTDEKSRTLLDGVDTDVADDRVLMIDSAEYAANVASRPTSYPDADVQEDDLFLLIFTSGSTGLPKAVRCTQGRLRADGHARRNRRGAGSRRRGVRAVAVLPLQRTLHRVVVGPQCRGSDLDAAAVLGVEHAARHTPLRRLDAGVHREGPELHPGHA